MEDGGGEEGGTPASRYSTWVVGTSVLAVSQFIEPRTYALDTCMGCTSVNFLKIEMLFYKSIGVPLSKEQPRMLSGTATGARAYLH